jgi:3,4-dihydroxy 2-butanone 4-phosphate synthase/GTP cyclohydrolase II
MADPISPLYQLIQSAPLPPGRPFITLTYAQSLDGSIAATPNQQINISAPRSLEMTHQLRSLHDGIMVGVGTILADDPQLTVRYVQGSNPRPIVLDTKLRTPLESQVFQSECTPLFFHGPAADPEHIQSFQQRGVELCPCPLEPSGILDGSFILRELRSRGVNRLMVEGGAKVIDYLLQAGTADLLVLTIAPQLIGGLRPVAPSSPEDLPELRHIQWQRLGDDMILWGQLAETAS